MAVQGSESSTTEVTLTELNDYTIQLQYNGVCLYCEGKVVLM